MGGFKFFPFGDPTCLVVGKLSLLRTKWDVAPESMTMACCLTQNILSIKSFNRLVLFAAFNTGCSSKLLSFGLHRFPAIWASCGICLKFPALVIGAIGMFALAVRTFFCIGQCLLVVFALFGSLIFGSCICGSRYWCWILSFHALNQFGHRFC